jgi:hypothetical protein
MSKARKVPTPFRVLWREGCHDYLPPVMFGAAVILAVGMWRSYLIPTQDPDRAGTEPAAAVAHAAAERPPLLTETPLRPVSLSPPASREPGTPPTNLLATRLSEPRRDQPHLLLLK